MKVTIVLGSARKGRQSHKIAHYLQHQLAARAVETDLIDLAEDRLPLLEDSLGFEELIQKIGARLAAADALIFVTPEYHGSFSGVLKNALDYFWAEFQRKPIGVATVSSGRLGGINASTQLQHVILSLGAYPLPLKLLVPEIHNAFEASSNQLNDTITESARKFLDEFLWFAEAIADKKMQEVQKLEKA
jgi:NAD(P)H-dependent FMN reductase